MRLNVSDIGSNFEENLQRWARALGKGEIKRKIFLTVYSNRKARWSVQEIADETRLSTKDIATFGRQMCVGGLFEQIEGPRVIYQKIAEVHHAKAKILRLAGDTKARENLPTKRSRGGAVRMSKITNNFTNVGVANTGRMSGQVRGNSQSITLNENAKNLMKAFEQFKKQIQQNPSLTLEQREDALHATADLEEEVVKPEQGRSMSRIRNAVTVLRTLAAGTDVAQKLYENLHPFIASHFHL